MYSSRSRAHRKEKLKKSKKDKQLSNLINNSDSDTGNESEHELSYYIEDRVKLMKEVLKIIKPKKIKSMAPDCMKRMQIEEINSMLLEELLGISKKRLKYIFEGKHLDEESSTDEDQPIDVISLDDISDDDFVIISDEEAGSHGKKKKRKKIKEEPKEKSKKIKKEKSDKARNKEKEKSKDKESGKEKKRASKDKEPMGEENLMSVLELLELQARARAIRSQLDLESKRKLEEQERLSKEQAEKAQKSLVEAGNDDDEDVIIEVPKEVEIIITSSDSEDEAKKKDKNKASTSEKNICTNSTNSTISVNTNENTHDLSIQANENSLQVNTDNTSPIYDNTKSKNKTGISENGDNQNKMVDDGGDKKGKKEGSENKEEGEVSSDCENDKCFASNDPTKLNENIETNKNSSEDISNNSSGSDSSDNLQIVMMREKRKKKGFKTSEIDKKSKDNLPERDKRQEVSTSSNVDNEGRSSNKDESVKQIINNKTQLEADAENDSVNNPKSDSDAIVSEEQTSDNQGQSKDAETQQSGSKIENAIAEFLKSQPTTSKKPELIPIILDEVKKKDKEKRLKNLKNKLQSYKKDVEGESNITILENIVIKPKAVDDAKSRNRVAEDSDDLVINVDQDDLDCIVCD